MIKRLFPLLIVVFAACSQQEKPKETNSLDTVAKVSDSVKTVAKDTVSDPIVAIRKKVEHINTQKREKKHFEFMCDEMMKIDYYYEDNEIAKITVDFGTVGDVYAREDYYYDKGELVFMYEFTEGGPACEGCIKKNEYRSYIANGKVIKYLKDQKQEKCSKCEFPKTSRQYKLLKLNTTEQIKDLLCR